jgi:acetyltransferase-like isoleucine patch superfamily enzyme
LKKEDTDPQGTSHRGFLGWYEKTLRQYKKLVLSLTLILVYLVVSLILGTAVAPAVYVVGHLFDWASTFTGVTSYWIKGVALVLGYLIYGFAAIIIVPIPNRLALMFLKPFRGPYYSISVFWWYIHNVLTYAVRYSFLEWITPTPYNLFFYRMMGMKIGDRVELNSTNISDPGLITLEDGVTIGGSATIIAHYAVHGYLIISPVIIRKNATVGLKAVIMGGVEIGEGAKVLPHSVVLPKTVIPAGETWAGVPASNCSIPRGSE